jgi:hypothetical protein
MEYEEILLMIAAIIGGIVIIALMPTLADKFCSVRLSEEALFENELRQRRNDRNRRTGAIPAILANMTEEERSKVLLEVLIIQSWSPDMKKIPSSSKSETKPVLESSSLSNIETDKKDDNQVDEENQNPSLENTETEHEENMCAICMEDYKPNDNVTIGTSCSHMYHKDCLLHWMSSNHDFCPYCREYFFDVTTFSSVAEKVLGSERYRELMTNDDPTVVSLYATTENSNANSNVNTTA